MTGQPNETAVHSLTLIASRLSLLEVVLLGSVELIVNSAKALVNGRKAHLSFQRKP